MIGGSHWWLCRPLAAMLATGSNVAVGGYVATGGNVAIGGYVAIASYVAKRTLSRLLIRKALEKAFCKGF